MSSHDHLELFQSTTYLLVVYCIFRRVSPASPPPFPPPRVTYTCLERLRQIVVPVSLASATMLWL